MDELAAFEKFWLAQLLTITGVTALIGTGDSARMYNSIAPAGTDFPYGIYQVIPLGDNTGQARSSIQTRLLVDSKFLSTLPDPDALHSAVAAQKEYFRVANQTSFSVIYGADSFRISVRHERPISYIEHGATADQQILHRGGTFAVWMHRL
jgi:hypothetical protein